MSVFLAGRSTTLNPRDNHPANVVELFQGRVQVLADGARVSALSSAVRKRLLVRALRSAQDRAVNLRVISSTDRSALGLLLLSSARPKPLEFRPDRVASGCLPFESRSLNSR